MIQRLCLLALLSASVAASTFALDIKPLATPSAHRQALMLDYIRWHCGLESIALPSPQIIVIHCTETADLKGALAYFGPDELGGMRPDLGNHGLVNVGIHFLVDLDGTIYQMTPLDQMTRHTIGFNHTSIGIENVAADESLLTPAQLEANVQLVAWLKTQRPSLDYLIGHDEYMKTDKPHFKLRLELDKTYKPTWKKDPGPAFMQGLRQKLKTALGLTFLD